MGASMSTHGSSSVGWIVGTLAERDEILALLQDDGVHEPRDELGMASLRDVMSDAFFPGVTTIQTRAKYFLFVPAMYDLIENDPKLRRKPEDSIRRLEESLLVGLLHRHADGGERGIIGERFKRPPQNPSSGIYWRGLSTWGIRRFHNSRSEYHGWLRQPSRRLQWRELEEGVDDDPPRWSGASEDVLTDPTLELRPDQAQFLQGCVLRLRPRPRRPLMTDLLGEDVTGCDSLWDTKAVRDEGAAVADLARDAQRVSTAIGGAMLLYNLLCARRFAPPSVDRWTRELGNWRAVNSSDTWSAWNRDEFWERIGELPVGPQARARTQGFLDAWVNVLQQDHGPLGSSRQIEERICDRERRTKPGRERLSRARNQQNWTPQGVGTEPMMFRWPRAKQMLIDMSAG